MGNGGSSRQQRAAGWKATKRELPRILKPHRRIILGAVIGLFGIGAPLLVHLVFDDRAGWLWALNLVLIGAGSALFGTLMPLVLWLPFDKGRLPRVPVLDERLIEKILDPDDNVTPETVNLEALRNVVRSRRVILPTSIALQAALAGSGCFIVAGGLLMGVEWYSLIAFPFLALTGAVSIPGLLASLGRVEIVADLMPEPAAP